MKCPAWQVKILDLENGLRLYYHHGAKNENVSGIGIKAGSIYDPPGKVGMAHFVEHLICRKSERHPDSRGIDLLCRKYMGGPDDGINIRTDRWSVFYGHDNLLRRKYMEEILDVMTSFVHPKSRIIDLEGMQVEKAAIHQEYYLRGIDWIIGYLDDLMHQTMYERNPIRNRLDCEVDDLKRITLKDAERFLRRYYVPKNAFAIIMGPKVEIAKALAMKHLGDWEGRRIPILDYDHTDDVPELSSVRPCEVDLPGTHQFHCGIGFPTETYKTNDAEVIDVLARILETRLHWALRDGNREFDGGAYRTPVYAERSFVHGMLYASFATSSREFEAHAEEVTLRECERMKTDLVSHEELDTAIGTLHNHYLDAFWNTPGSLCEMVIAAAANGDEDLKKMHSYRGEILRVNRRKVRTIANKYLTKNYVRVLIRPA